MKGRYLSLAFILSRLSVLLYPTLNDRYEESPATEDYLSSGKTI